MYILIAIFGLIIGSFLNVLIYRLPRNESIVWPGSHCTSCGHKLQPLDLVPVLSYVVLRGKCRYCGEKIAWRYTLVELLNAVGFVLVYQQSGMTLNSLAGCILTSVLIVVSFTDIDKGIIPDTITYPVALIGLIISIWTVGIKSSAIGMTVYAGVFFLMALISRGGMGGGDVKLGAVIGAFAGWPGAGLAMIMASLLGGLWAVGLLLSGKAGRKTAVKFGPFMALVGFVAFNYGPAILKAYMGLIL